MDERFIDSLREVVGNEVALRVLDAMGEDPSVSVRVNTAKLPKGLSSSDFVKENFGVIPRRVKWNENAFLLPQRPEFIFDPLFHAGAYYVQDSSAMFPGYAFRQFAQNVEGRPLRVLDLCGAPGGKTTDLSSSLRKICGRNYILVANEVVKSRKSILEENVIKWGDANVLSTCCDPKVFSDFEGFFDIILADVPCSGEGMFRKDSEALKQWSPANVDLCQARQKRILADVWPSLADGGVLIYSTCTFNNKENDGNIRWAADELGAEILTIDHEFDEVIRTKYGNLLLPGIVEGEGQYCAALRKEGGRTFKFPKKGRKDAIFKPEEEDRFSFPMKYFIMGEKLVAMPECIINEVMLMRSLQGASAGVSIGSLKLKDHTPDHSLAMCSDTREDAFPWQDVSKLDALLYLHRDVLKIDEIPLGISVVSYMGYPLGFIKNLGPRCNNLYPQNWRIRKDIPKNI